LNQKYELTNEEAPEELHVYRIHLSDKLKSRGVQLLRSWDFVLFWTINVRPLWGRKNIYVLVNGHPSDLGIAGLLIQKYDFAKKEAPEELHVYRIHLSDKLKSRGVQQTM
jgi:hypothetical protein